MTHLKEQKRGRSLEEILDLVHRYRRSHLSQRRFIVGEEICLTTLHKYLRARKPETKVQLMSPQDLWWESLNRLG
jgi:hypothetical protein